MKQSWFLRLGHWTLARGGPLLLGLCLLAFGGVGCGPSPDASRSGAAGAAAKYHCPMHPTYTSDRQGDCPICNMKLVPVKASGERAEADGGGGVSGRVIVHVSAEKQQQIGLTTERVEVRELAHRVRATGTLQHDETQLARIAPRFGGWVRRLHVAYTGQEVKQGDPLLTVYSPEVMATERDYLLALAQQRESLVGGTTEQRAAADQLLAGARQRLRLWGIADDEIAAVQERGEPGDELLLRATVSGHVVSKTAVEGRAFMAGETLYEIGQLSRLWVRVSVFESDLPRIALGQRAKVILPYLDQRVVESRVAFVYPHIDPRTRRAEVRLEVENPDNELRPDMWANVEIEVPLGKRLAVPQSAVIDTGTRWVAFVRREDHHLEPREIQVGVRTGDYLEVRSGLEEGEAVVTRALFLIDSESQLQSAIAGMSAGPAESSAAPHDH